MPLEIVRNDITKMDVDAIVNAANNSLSMGGGVCGAIFSAAGARELQEACGLIGHCPTGGAVITAGGKLPASHVIHAVGPVWQGGGKGEETLLRSCYREALKLASQKGLASIAFPLISSGIYGYPKDQALQVAVSEISRFLLEQEMDVYLVVFDKMAFDLGRQLFSDIQKYIDDHYVEESGYLYSGSRAGEAAVQEAMAPPESLEEMLEDLDGSFSEKLIRLIDERGIGDAEAYKRANIDRRVFSKIRSSKAYMPSKTTAAAFAIALELGLEETQDLLAAAGYTLSDSHVFDVIIKFFIERQQYDIHTVNAALFKYDQPLLGAKMSL